MKILAMIRERLAVDGTLFIETGNFENWKRTMRRDRWGLYLFDHQFYFSPASLEEVLRRAGFEGCRLLNVNREPPCIDFRKCFRQPAHSFHEWAEWVKAMSRWPRHGDINVMVMTARKGRS